MFREPALQTTHHYLPAEVRPFFRVHFGDANYDGYIYVLTRQTRLGHKNPSQCPFKTVAAVPMDKLEDFLSKMHVSEFGDYYLSANTFTSPKHRRIERLFTLNNLVIDIDCHRDTSPIRREAHIEHADYIRRIVRDTTGHTMMHRYIMEKGTWEDWDGNPLPY